MESYKKTIRNVTQDMLTPEVNPDDGFRLKVSLNPELFDSNKALTVQSFGEKNSKTGTQYEASFYNPAVAAGGFTYIAINVGNLKMLVKAIQLQFNGTLMTQTLFRGGSYDGGTPITVYNMNDELSVAHDVTIFGGVTPNLAAAVQVGPVITSLGKAKAIGCCRLSVLRLAWSEYSGLKACTY